MTFKILIALILTTLGLRSERIPQSWVNALILTESSGRCYVKGDGGKSWGCLQIGQAVIDDVNESYAKGGKFYILEDALDYHDSIDILNLYMKRYASPRRVGFRTFETVARMWNGGGGSGHKRNSTVAYWERVQKNFKLLAQSPQLLKIRNKK